MEKLRQKEYEAKQKEEEKNQPKKADWKMKRFQSVDAKVRNVPESIRNNGQDQYENASNRKLMNQKENLQDQQPLHRQNSRGKANNASQQIQMEMKSGQNQQKAVLMSQQQNSVSRQPPRLNSQQNISASMQNQEDQQYNYQIPQVKESNTTRHQQQQGKPKMSKKTESLYAAMQEEFQVSRVVIYDDTKLMSIEDIKVPLYGAPLKPPMHNAPQRQHKTQRADNHIKIQEPARKEQISMKPPVYQQPKPRETPKIQQEYSSPQYNQYDDQEEVKAQPKSNSGQPKNYLKDNMQEVLNKKAKNDQQQNSGNNFNDLTLKHHKAFGKVPKYLTKYNQQKEDEIEYKRRLEEDSKIPVGTRLMPEDERLRTLEDLELTNSFVILLIFFNSIYEFELVLEINNMLEKLPLANQSMALQKRKREMEEKLNSIDKAIQTFSKKTVYVAL